MNDFSASGMDDSRSSSTFVDSEPSSTQHELSKKHQFINRLLSMNHLIHGIFGEIDSNNFSLFVAALSQLKAPPTEFEAATFYLQTGGFIAEGVPGPSLRPWLRSTPEILDQWRFWHFGDPQWEKGYMDYFRVEHTLKSRGETEKWALGHLLRQEDGRSLFSGLFNQLGRSLHFLGWGFDMPNAVLVIEGLTLAAVDWSPRMEQVFASFAEDTANSSQLPVKVKVPTYYLEYMRTDGRLENAGSGRQTHYDSFLALRQEVVGVLMNYARQLQISDDDSALFYMARVSVLMACASHRPGEPLFDLHFARLPSLVFSLRMVIQRFADMPNFTLKLREALIRGVWMQILVCYLLRGRPLINEALVFGPTTQSTWEEITNDIRAHTDAVQSANAQGKGKGKEEDKYRNPFKYRNHDFPRLLASILRLAVYERDPEWYRTMASYLINNWKMWGSPDGSEGGHLNSFKV